VFGGSCYTADISRNTVVMRGKNWCTIRCSSDVEIALAESALTDPPPDVLELLPAASAPPSQRRQSSEQCAIYLSRCQPAGLGALRVSVCIRRKCHPRCETERHVISNQRAVRRSCPFSAAHQLKALAQYISRLVRIATESLVHFVNREAKYFWTSFLSIAHFAQPNL